MTSNLGMGETKNASLVVAAASRRVGTTTAEEIRIVSPLLSRNKLIKVSADAPGMQSINMIILADSVLDISQDQPNTLEL